MNAMKSDPGVSPVIATILLVAITVTLVAIISAVVLGMVGGVDTHKDVGVTVKTVLYNLKPGDSLDMYLESGVQVILYGGRDIDKLTNLTVSIEGADGVAYLDPNAVKFALNEGGGTQGVISNPIGIPFVYIPYPAVRENTRDYQNIMITVTGKFADGSVQVLSRNKMSLQTYPGNSFLGVVDSDDMDVMFPKSPLFA